MRRMVWSAALVSAVLCACVSAAGAQGAPVSLELDAREVARDIVHVHERIAVDGPVTLVLPKWIPGEHGPNGSIVNLVNLRISSAGRPVAFTRDSLDNFAFHIAVPPGAGALDVRFDHLFAPRGDSTTPNLAIVNWVDAVLYPAGARAADVRVAASIMLPPDWSFGTALAPLGAAGPTQSFAPVSLETLVDSPVAAGRYVRKIPLGDTDGLNEAVIVADSPDGYDLKEGTIAALKNLIVQTDALTGARHWRTYHFLIALADPIAHFGLEHHESSDDRLNANGLTDPAALQLSGDLLPHEYFHSWNGKYRRPAGLATPNYQVPMQDELLWVYEGLTTYYGQVLSFRSGFRKIEDYPDFIALVAAQLDTEPGRATRPLVDTAIGIPVASGRSGTYPGLRRGSDYYPEGAMVWLEADQIIRERSGGLKTLDDFVRAFYGGPANTAPAVVPYTRSDVIAALAAIQPYDWKTFFDTRIDSVQPRLAPDGLAKAGWRLVYNDVPNVYATLRETAGRAPGLDARYSLGAQFATDGSVIDVFANTPAGRAGLAPGMRLLAVNGKTYSTNALRDAIKAAKGTRAAIALIAQDAGFVKIASLDYHEGEKFPHLERIAERPDTLTAGVKPLAPRR
ncbi:MAG: M61 family metallopeptidase [Candidatus Velthaea sp.]